MSFLNSAANAIAPIPSDLSWSDVDHDETVCMECGTISEVKAENLLTRHVTCPNEACEETDGFVFHPIKLPVVSIALAAAGFAITSAVLPGLSLLGAAVGGLFSMHSRMPKLAHRGGM